VSTASPAIIEITEDTVDGLKTLRDVAPPPALVARVMTRVGEPTTPSLWQWLAHPVRIELRISPLGVLATGVVLAIALALFVAR
jgi:hypothetical protein